MNYFVLFLRPDGKYILCSSMDARNCLSGMMIPNLFSVLIIAMNVELFKGAYSMSIRPSKYFLPAQNRAEHYTYGKSDGRRCILLSHIVHSAALLWGCAIDISANIDLQKLARSLLKSLFSSISHSTCEYLAKVALNSDLKLN